MVSRISDFSLTGQKHQDVARLMWVAPEFIERVRRTFGCFEPEEEILPPEVNALLIEREAARGEKDFSASDSLRIEIEKHGFTVLDTPNGQKIRRI